jgi:NAD-dependent SIR2 family protein deacetylase
MIGAEIYASAAELIASADSLIITAGAGIGVDSGLVDFRSHNGFWNAYPALGRASILFESIATPDAFRRDPRLAWGFYGHRLNLYRQTTPHRGFALLQEIGASLEHGAFVFTSNVDGQFRKAGFAEERIDEIHGSLHHLQCMDERCPIAIWSADGFNPGVEEAACRLTSELPTCRYCGGLARPNVLMFGDWEWRRVREMEQAKRLGVWLGKVRRPVVIEIGAGTDIPTVRMFSDRFERLIRINPREPQVCTERAIGFAVGGLEGLTGIHSAMGL